MEQQPERPAADHHDFFDVYKLAVEDLRAARDQGERVDNSHISLVTLLFTADAYEIVTGQFNTWTPTIATIAVAVIGMIVISRWRAGASNAFRIITNRYAWLRAAEDMEKHPEMAEIGANIFTQEYQSVYLPQRGFPRFYAGQITFQSLLMILLALVPVIIGAITFFNLNPAVVQAILSAIP